MSKRAFSLLFVAMMLSSSLAITTPKANASLTSLEVVPSAQTFGPGDCVDTTFTITVEVHNVTDLYGVDIQFGWDEAWINYVTHSKRIPVETYADGILHSPTIPVKNQVSEGVPMGGADPNSDYWLAEASMVPAPVFTGSGLAFEMTFTIKQQPIEPEPDKVLTLNITTFTLADSSGDPILDVLKVNGAVTIKAKSATLPEKPLLRLLPLAVSGIPACNDFTIEILLAAWNATTNSVVNLDSLWDVAGFDIVVNFDSTLIEAVNVTIDPNGWFAAFWPTGLFIVKQEIDNVAGTTRIVFLGLPDEGDPPPHTSPSGQGIIVKLIFHSIYNSRTYPPKSCVIGLAPTTIAGFPWNSSEPALPLEHFVQNATYTSYFKPSGAWIDVYTQYPYPFGGQGPNRPSDMFWPQKQVCLFAEVTYNFWPEQQKDVAFQIIDPHGETLAIICNKTDANGIARIMIGLPWPCDDPEFWFGTWTVFATVNVASVVVNDTLEFKYDYHVRVWKTTLDKEAYKHSEWISVTIDYGSVSMQEFSALFTITGLDETDVPFGSTYAWVTVGGAEWCAFANGTITLKIYIAKSARVGVGTVHVHVLSNWLDLGGEQIYPTREPETIVHFYIEAPIIRDVAIVNIEISSNSLYIGEILQIYVTVLNKGNGVETLDVETYYNSSLIQSDYINDLAPKSEFTLTIAWNTTFVSEGFYQISASAFLPDDVVPSDNTYVDGIVEVKSEVTPPIMIHDIAVLNVVPSPTSVYVGETVEISVTVKNLGNYTESFTLMVYYDSSLIESRLVQNLVAKTERVLVFSWDTSDVAAGNYTLTARASAVLGEENLDDNHYVDGIVQIKTLAPPLIHDIAILGVTPYSSIIYVGDTVDINVTVKNKGTETETFNVTVYYDSNTIATLTVNNLVAGAEYVLVFEWNTRNVPIGTYTLSASAPLPNDVNVSDNTFTDGIVRVAVPPTRWFVPEWVYWFLLPLLLLLILLLVLLLYRRRRKKRAEEAFSSGWTAWYYFYDLKNASGDKSKGPKVSHLKPKK